MSGRGRRLPIESRSRITVLHFTSAPVRGGAEEHMLMLLRQLDSSRYRPMLAAHPKLLAMVRSELPDNVESFPLELQSLRDLRGAWRLWRVMREKRVDIVHSHMFQASRLASPLAFIAGVPAIIETPHVREHWRRGWIKGSFAVDRLIGRIVTRYIAVSNANRDYLVHEKRLPAHKVVVIRNAIPTADFDPAAIAPSELREHYGIESGIPVVVVLARLEPQKGHRTLLEAWRSVVAAHPRARLVCVGEGSLRAELQNYAGALGLGAAVTFAGYQTNVPDWLALSEFTVLPSLFEGLPLAALESLAAGRAVVATAVDGSAEAISDGETGLLVPSASPAPLASAICRLLEAPELAHQMGAAGRRRVEQDFDQTRQVNETEAIYEMALGLAGAPGSIGKELVSGQSLSGGRVQ
jgi:glycosyltransferase involved in cell wall biosynthesis